MKEYTPKQFRDHHELYFTPEGFNKDNFNNIMGFMGFVARLTKSIKTLREIINEETKEHGGHIIPPHLYTDSKTANLSQKMQRMDALCKEMVNGQALRVIEQCGEEFLRLGHELEVAFVGDKEEITLLGKSPSDKKEKN